MKRNVIQYRGQSLNSMIGLTFVDQVSSFDWLNASLFIQSSSGLFLFLFPFFTELVADVDTHVFVLATNEPLFFLDVESNDEQDLVSIRFAHRAQP